MRDLRGEIRALGILASALAAFLLQTWGSLATAGGIPPEQNGSLGISARWTNSLGMEFIAVPGTEAMFCIWKTRVQDFETFVRETRYDATSKGWCLSTGGGPVEGQLFGFGISTSGEKSFLPKTGTWKNPGFKQGPTHPVCGVSWHDAHAFCSWLTKRERQRGEIGPDKVYRLPTDAEWSSAAAGLKYCWGDQWPPPEGVGNFAGEEVLNSSWPTNRLTIQGYRDGFPRTSPVGSFPPNPYGIYDLVGNLSEWCEDVFRKAMNPDELRKQNPQIDLAPPGCRVVRGASWGAATPLGLSTAKRGWSSPDGRAEGIGFRVVIAPKKEAEEPPETSEVSKNQSH